METTALRQFSEAEEMVSVETIEDLKDRGMHFHSLRDKTARCPITGNA